MSHPTALLRGHSNPGNSIPHNSPELLKEHSSPGYSVQPNSPAKTDSLTHAKVSHPTALLRGHSNPGISIPHNSAELLEEHSSPGYSVRPKSPAKTDSLTHAKVSHPTALLRGHSNPGISIPHNSPELLEEHSSLGYSVPPSNLAKVDTLSQATVSHLTTELRGTLFPKLVSHPTQLRQTLLPRLQCPTQQSSKGGHSYPGYSVPTYNRAEGDTLTQATLSHQLRCTL